MSALKYRSDVQGLRAIAVLAVMVFHLNPSWMPGGFIGVDVFFVISGFLITSILIKMKNQPDFSLAGTLRYFYTSRFKRIAPAYFATLLVVTLVAATLFLPSDFATYKNGLEKAAWFFSNDYFANFGDYFAPSSHEQPLLHTWSLAVEIQFYLLAPLLILLLSQKYVKWVLAVLLVGFVLLSEYRLRVTGVEQATYYSLYARLPEFFAGCLAAFYQSDFRRKSIPGGGALGLLLIISAALAQPSLGHFPGMPVLVPIVGSVLLLISSKETIASKILSTKALLWIGTLSYSLYLWHWPVLAFIRYFTGADVLDITFTLLFVLMTFGLSMISYYWVERPLRSRTTGKKQLVGWAILVAAMLGTSQTMAKVNDAFSPPLLDIEYRRYADPATICHGKVISDCIRGDKLSSREILVLGDSHGAMLNSFFDAVGKDFEFKARVITASGCLTIPGFDYWRIAEWAQNDCIRQIKEGEKYIGEVSTVVLVGKWRYHVPNSEFMEALSDFLKVMDSNGKSVVILSQIPMFTQSALRARRFKALGTDGSLEKDPAYLSANKKVEALVAEYANARYVDLSNLPLFDDAPFYHNNLIYKDRHHLNEVGAQAYAQDAIRYLSGPEGSSSAF
ncbi:acyltransferase family protein [Marinobacter salinexigens]|uniref:Acyltransferase family protein n=1 Tax=Marinobacter salinexigens TaxID=2919747 RepID=A0A5B0VJN9_9GAMM|nr:acyltransferase family protein [Marinobacter salinexigens]KAA1174704.1 acyltransferase family protein [Marinobacter salinexigens]